jgi:hypothetical protein
MEFWILISIICRTGPFAGQRGHISGVKLTYKFGILSAIFILAGVAAPCADLAILRNGRAIRHERREAREDMTRLYLNGAPDNYVDIPVDQIVRFEKADELPAPAIVRRPVAVSLEEVVSAASNHNSVDPDLVLSVIRAESGFDPMAVSAKGALGLMQLMPQTAARLGVDNPMDPVANVEGGTRYLRELLAQFNHDLIKALAAYNAGPQRIQQYHGVPPYTETLTYISRVIRDLNRRKLAQTEQQRYYAGKLGSRLQFETSGPGLSFLTTTQVTPITRE